VCKFGDHEAECADAFLEHGVDGLEYRLVFVEPSL
jgi:hypothetical protein